MSRKANFVLEDYVIAFNYPISTRCQHMLYGLAVIFFDIWPLYVTVI